MNFGVFGTKRTVCNREVSILQRVFGTKTENCLIEKCLYYRGDCKELFDCTFFILQCCSKKKE